MFYNSGDKNTVNDETTTRRAQEFTVPIATPVKLFTPMKQKLEEAFPGVHISKPKSYEEGDKVYCEQCGKWYTKKGITRHYIGKTHKINVEKYNEM